MRLDLVVNATDVTIADLLGHKGLLTNRAGPGPLLEVDRSDVDVFGTSFLEHVWTVGAFEPEGWVEAATQRLDLGLDRGVEPGIGLKCRKIEVLLVRN